MKVEIAIGMVEESSLQVDSLPLLTENSLQVSEASAIQGLIPCRGVRGKQVDPRPLASKVQNQVVLEIGETQKAVAVNSTVVHEDDAVETWMDQRVLARKGVHGLLLQTLVDETRLGGGVLAWPGSGGASILWGSLN